MTKHTAGRAVAVADVHTRRTTPRPVALDGQDPGAAPNDDLEPELEVVDALSHSAPDHLPHRFAHTMPRGSNKMAPVPAGLAPLGREADREDVSTIAMPRLERGSPTSRRPPTLNDAELMILEARRAIAARKAQLAASAAPVASPPPASETTGPIVPPAVGGFETTAMPALDRPRAEPGSTATTSDAAPETASAAPEAASAAPEAASAAPEAVSAAPEAASAAPAQTRLPVAPSRRSQHLVLPTILLIGTLAAAAWWALKLTGRVG